MIQGNIDYIQEDEVSGWVWDTEQHDKDIFVEITIPGEQTVLTRASLYRADLEEAGIGGGRCGFSAHFFDVNSPLFDSRNAIKVKVIGTPHVLRYIHDKIGRLGEFVKSFYRPRVSQQNSGHLQFSPSQKEGDQGSYRTAALIGNKRFGYFAKITSISGSKITVVTDALPLEGSPVVTVGGKPAWPSPDILEQQDMPRPVTLHEFFISGISEGDEIVLSLAVGEEVWLCEIRTAQRSFLERAIIEQMTSAAMISSESGAVALACGDGTRQMSRNTELLRLISKNRPAVLFCFLNDAIGLDVWQPLSEMNVAVVTIPWSERIFYFRMARIMDVSFDTVYVCGLELRSLLLAAEIAANDAIVILDVPENTSVNSGVEHPDLHENLSAGLSQLLSKEIVSRTTDAISPTTAEDIITLDPSESDAYSCFEKAEGVAVNHSRACKAFSILPNAHSVSPAKICAPPTLLLIWKQHDAGFYGRRVDQLARSYLSLHPEHRAVVLEILNKDTDGIYHQSVSGFSEFTHIREMNIRKMQGVVQTAEGVEYRQIRINSPQMLNPELLEFLVAHDIMPTNTVVVAFPNIQYLEWVFDILNPYPLIVDVVDNQLAWAEGKARLDVLRQYFMLCHRAKKLMFNSSENCERFSETGLISRNDERVEIIPNWYQLPKKHRYSTKHTDQNSSQWFDLIYTGNMNDRIDWALVTKLIGLNDKIRLHLVGEAREASEGLFRLLQNDRVIHYGPLNEEHTLEVLLQADLAVIPHVTDEVSAYMNPLKARMYEAINLPTIATNVPGLSVSALLEIVESHTEFLTSVQTHMVSAQDISSADTETLRDVPSEARRYCAIIEQMRKIK